MDPFLGEIKICAFPFAPKGWAFCNGALMSIQQNNALFALLGVQYGGDGKTTFALPDLRGRVAMHRDGSTYVQGRTGGQETVALQAAHLPLHNHGVVVASSPATSPRVGGTAQNILAATATNIYGAATNLVPMEAGMTSTIGAGAAHENMQPSLVINYIIATTGIFPSRN
ncbi:MULTISPECIES: phage tail protein [unclassified Undibacterium]|uniref:phage tail protein n=1 Tax=unclassified Undibacterium TaxID=2630295 RepID=UPI003C2C3702